MFDSLGSRALFWVSLVLALPSLTFAAEKARNPAEIAADLDRAIDRGLETAKVPASPRSDDGEFIRRATLDLLGRIPLGERAESFLDSRAPDKREKLIAELLTSPEYGRHFGMLWHNRINPRDSLNEQDLNRKLFFWLADGFNRNRAWSATVSELLLAEGDKEKTPALGFYLSHLNTVEGFVEAERVAGSVAELFLGVNLRCAQCHDHPFAPWKQTDFWALAAFFGRVGVTRKLGDKILVESATIRSKEQDRSPTARADATILIPGKQKVVKARFLGGKEPYLPADKPFRPVLVEWLTSPTNERFAQALVNRLWAQLFGKGLVNPIDDFRTDNPPSYPEILHLLTREFIASGHDQKHLLRCILLSKTYQRTSRPLPGNKADPTLFSHMALKQLSGEALWDSLMQVLDGLRFDKDLVKSVENPGRVHWLVHFSTFAPDEAPTRYTHSVPQVLRMLNTHITNSHELPLIRRIHRDKIAREKAVELLYLEILSRRPTAVETKLFVKYMEGVRDSNSAYRDVWWTLANTSEFLFNH